MSFRKRSVGLSSTSNIKDTPPPTDPGVRSPENSAKTRLLGTRPSPLDGRSTTSTGVSSLDALLAGHAGLPLGCSILIEESGTTDYAGAIIKFFSAEGLTQGHWLHVVGPPEAWARDLPGLVGGTTTADSRDERSGSEVKEKMKIAWRYESLIQGQSGRRTDGSHGDHKVADSQPSNGITQTPTDVFCHTFDLSKRLVLSASSQIKFYPIPSSSARSPLSSVLKTVAATLFNAPADAVHRIVIPSLLSPSLYPPLASQPEHVLQFIHGLRALTARCHQRVITMMSLPLSLFPRSSGIVRWIEILNDAVIELTPFPHSSDAALPAVKPAGAGHDEPPQGLLRLHRLPILHERGSGNNSADDDWTFTLSRRRMVIKPFNLPPVEGDTEAQQAAAGDGNGAHQGSSHQKPKKADMEF